MVECTCKCASIIFISIWSIVAIIVAITVSQSFSTIELNTAGLKFDRSSYTIDETSIYLPGRYYIGLGSEFKVFPLNYQSIDYLPSAFGQIMVKTNDPVQINLEVSVAYSIRQEFLIQFYKLYPNMDYHYEISNSVQGIIIATAQNYSVNEFFSMRGSISDQMANNINTQFRSYFIELEIFELRDIIIGEALEQKIKYEVKTLNDGNIKNAMSVLYVNEGYIDMIKAENEKNVTTILNQAYQYSNDTINQAESQAIVDRINNHTFYFKSYVDTNGLGFTPADLSKFMYYLYLDENTFFQEKDLIIDDFIDTSSNTIKNFGLKDIYVKE